MPIVELVGVQLASVGVPNACTSLGSGPNPRVFLVLNDISSMLIGKVTFILVYVA